MELETKLLGDLAGRFSGIDTEKAVIAPRRIYLELPLPCFMDALAVCANELGFRDLCTITGLDTGEFFEFIYHISNLDGVLLSLKYKTGREDPVTIPSVLPIYQGATFYERELESLLGVKVEGLPEGRQYPLPDNWPQGQYPMRKGWTPPPKNGANGADE